MYTNECSCAILATQTEWGAVLLFGNSRVPCHHITPHSRVVQIAETFWFRSFILCWLVNYFIFSKINSITALQAAAAEF